LTRENKPNLSGSEKPLLISRGKKIAEWQPNGAVLLSRRQRQYI
jgi:hypothetical protein